jgi:predicted permease
LIKLANDVHALSLGTWWIHVTSLLEWMLAIVLIERWGRLNNNRAMSWLALAMLPNLMSAMAAITWHLFDNSEALRGLIVLQAGLTLTGNTCLAAATWNLFRTEGAKP